MSFYIFRLLRHFTRDTRLSQLNHRRNHRQAILRKCLGQLYCVDVALLRLGEVDDVPDGLQVLHNHQGDISIESSASRGITYVSLDILVLQVEGLHENAGQYI